MAPIRLLMWVCARVSFARKGIRAVAQLGSALDWGSRGRRFKSCQPDRPGPDLFQQVRSRSRSLPLRPLRRSARAFSSPLGTYEVERAGAAATKARARIAQVSLVVVTPDTTAPRVALFGRIGCADPLHGSTLVEWASNGVVPQPAGRNGREGTTRLGMAGLAAASAIVLAAGPSLATECVNASKPPEAGIQVLLGPAGIEWSTPGVAKRISQGLIDPDTGAGFHGLIGFDFDGNGPSTSRPMSSAAMTRSRSWPSSTAPAATASRTWASTSANASSHVRAWLTTPDPAGSGGVAPRRGALSTRGRSRVQRIPFDLRP